MNEQIKQQQRGGSRPLVIPEDTEVMPSIFLLCVCERERECLYLLHSEVKNKFLVSRVKALLESEDILDGPHNFKGLFERSDLVLRVRLEWMS